MYYVKNKLKIKPMSKFQTNYGLGKLRDQVSNLILVIENIKSELESDKTFLDPKLIPIKRAYLNKLLVKAQEDYKLALVNLNQ